MISWKEAKQTVKLQYLCWFKIYPHFDLIKLYQAGSLVCSGNDSQQCTKLPNPMWTKGHTKISQCRQCLTEHRFDIETCDKDYATYVVFTRWIDLGSGLDDEKYTSRTVICKDAGIRDIMANSHEHHAKPGTISARFWERECHIGYALLSAKQEVFHGNIS